MIIQRARNGGCVCVLQGSDEGLLVLFSVIL